MSDTSDFDALFDGRPETIRIEGVGDVPVQYADSDERPLPPVGPGDVYAVSPEVGAVVLDTEVVVYRATDATAHVLDAVAALLWQCIDGVSTLHEIFSDIADAFGQSLDAIASDLATAVAEWKRDGLVVLAGAAAQDARPAEVQFVDGWRHLVDPPNN